MAVELVGGALLSALLEVLVDNLASPEFVNFFRGNRIVTKLFEKLNITLWSANALLNDAEDKQIMDGNIKHWVDKLNEVLNEADHVMDKINTKAMRREIKGRWSARRIMKKVVSNDSPFRFDQEIKQDIEELIDMLKFLLEQKDYLGLKEGVKSKRLQRSPAPLITDPSSVIGRVGNKEAIVELLLSENVCVEISVIPIVGMGGVGKTTLARLVYDDGRVKDHFENRAWVTVSDDFDVFRLAKLVFESLTSKQSEAKEIGKLRDELKTFLRGKKFFLVLDDVWNENYGRWNALKSFLQVGGDGSKIIMTTRNEDIGSKMGTVQSHPLATMSDEDCWKLFKKHALHNVDPPKDLEEIGRAIVKKCKGLPLAVMSLAGLLCSVSDPKEWNDILKSDVWDLQRKGNDEILPSLWLSYNYLPPHLKRCFAYCSIFPKDYKHKKRSIVSLWMAEGLLQGENMEDVGEEYLKTLISRSLIQRSTEDDSSFVMHDLVHDMATFVSGKGFCIRSVERKEVLGLTDKTRHFVFGSHVYKKNSVELSKAKHLRTILSISASNFPYRFYFDKSMAKKFEGLRVLCLFGSTIKKVPDSIGKLKQLRYLDLSNTDIERLPDAICTLYNLQTLLLYRCSRLKRLPANMRSLVNLRHVNISYTRIESALFSQNLRELSIDSLKGLRSLTLWGCRMLKPISVHCLPSLKILDIHRCDEMKALLAIDQEMNTTFPSLERISVLDCPKLQFTGLPLPSSLKQLFIWNCNMLFAQRMQWGLKALTKLAITEDNADSFPEEGLLPTTLTHLIIWDFPNLKSLNGKGFQHLTSLKRLEIFYCPQLQSLPEEGLPTSLEWLHVQGCPILKERLKRETGEDWHSISHIPTIYVDRERDFDCRLWRCVRPKKL